jgi:hypothetical protein
MPRTDCLLAIKWLAITLLVSSWTHLAAAACPFCPPSQPSVSEQLTQSDLALLVEWVQVFKPTGDAVGAEPQTVFEVLDVLKQPQGDVAHAKGDRVKVDFLREGKPRDWFVLTATQKEGITNWGPIWEVDENIYGYIKHVPAWENPTAQRLEFFLKYLETDDTFIANDAFAEFGRSKYEDVAALAPKLSRAKIRRWLEDPDEKKLVRHGFYGLLLGLCGNQVDARYLESRILPSPAPDQVRIGIDGLMAGYILLTGERGLNKLLDVKLHTPDRIDGEVLFVVSTLRFFGDYAPDRVPKTQLIDAMRLLLDDEKHAEAAVVDLARWKDWDSAPRLIAAYGKPPFDERSGKQKLVQFALTAQKNLPAGSPLASSVRAFLDRLRSEEPDVVRATERLLNPPRKATETPKRNPLKGNLDDRPAGAANRNP